MVGICRLGGLFVTPFRSFDRRPKGVEGAEGAEGAEGVEGVEGAEGAEGAEGVVLSSMNLTA